MNKIINKIASDLGIYRFREETVIEYKCRVLYSAMASWIKAIALDQPVGTREECIIGVSRRHIYVRSCEVFNSLMGIFPETSYWFELDSANIHPVNIIRERLINHEDLLNVGFDTNLSLASAHSCQLTSQYESVYGKVLGDGVIYSGITTLLKAKADTSTEIERLPFVSIEDFMKKALWIPMALDSLEPMYFDPTHYAKNNYSAWKNTLPNCKSKTVLARIQINNATYEYYLLKPEMNLMHKIDPFLQGQGYHTLIMYELRKRENNNVIATAVKYNDHVRITLYTHLPTRERILLESYAWPYHRIDDKLCWIMYDYIWEYIKPYFELLGMQIMEERHG